MPSTFAIPDSDPGLCNAIRRSLLSDVSAWAPKEVDIRCNTSWQTDEYIAQRIGLIPFRRIGNVNHMTLRMRGPGVVRASDLVGPGFEPAHGSIEIITLPTSEQQLDMTVHFDEQKASRHARYSKCCAVGMWKEGGEHRIRFDTTDASPPLDALLEAIDALDARAQSALKSLATQPARIPASI